MASIFETQTCKRCGGTGKYSFNLIDGSRCYGCSGRGYNYTPRGEAAKKYLDGLLTVTVAELKVGDKIKDATFTGTVTAINEDGSINASGHDVMFGYMEDCHMTGFQKFRRIPEAAELKQYQEKALAYQATLTKTGTVAKKYAAA